MVFFFFFSLILQRRRETQPARRFIVTLLSLGIGTRGFPPDAVLASRLLPPTSYLKQHQHASECRPLPPLATKYLLLATQITGWILRRMSLSLLNQYQQGARSQAWGGGGGFQGFPGVNNDLPRRQVSGIAVIVIVIAVVVVGRAHSCWADSR